jgi:hypothetical protein
MQWHHTPKFWARQTTHNLRSLTAGKMTGRKPAQAVRARQPCLEPAARTGAFEQNRPRSGPAGGGDKACS